MDEATLSHLKATCERREMLGTLRPVCGKCGEAFQIQLREYLGTPAKWKCRTCGYKWEYEPPAAAHERVVAVHREG